MYRLPVLILQKRVVPFFVADGGGAAVAGQHYGVFWQHQQFLADIAQEVGMAAAFEIGAADGFVKQHVACDQQVLFGAVKHHMAGRVAGDVQHLEAVCAHVQLVALFQPAARAHRRRHGKTKVGGDFGQVVEQPLVSAVRADYRQLGMLNHLGHAAGMVEMAVGKPDGFGLHAEFGGFFQQLRHVSTHVYPHGFFAFFVPQERTVLAERGNGEHGKVERHGWLSL